MRHLVGRLVICSLVSVYAVEGGSGWRRSSLAFRPAVSAGRDGRGVVGALGARISAPMRLGAARNLSTEVPDGALLEPGEHERMKRDHRRQRPSADLISIKSVNGAGRE